MFTFVLDGTMTAVNDAARSASRPPVETVSPPATAPVPVAAHVEREASPKTQKAGVFAKYWRMIIGVMCLLAPFGSFGDNDVYTGPFILDALKFLGILAGLWVIGLALIGWHLSSHQPSPERIGDQFHS